MFKKGDKVTVLKVGSFTGLQGEVIQTPNSKTMDVWVEVEGMRFLCAPSELKAVTEEVEVVTIKTIDVTPTWSDIMPALLAVIESGTPEGKRMAKDELMSLARQVDAINAKAKGE